MKTALIAVCLGFSALIASTAHGQEAVRFGVDATYPPFEYKNPQGEMVGFDIELGKEICRRAHLDCSFVQSSFDGLVPGLLARKFDGILSCLSVTEQRRKQIAFSSKLFSIKSRLLARSGSSITPTVEGLKGKTVGVQQGTVQESYARTVWKPAGVNIRAFQTQEQAYADLVNGRLDATLQDELQAKLSFLLTDQGKGFDFAGPAIADETQLSGDTAIGLRKEDIALKAKIDQAIAGMLADGTYETIARKRFDFDIYGH